MALVVIPYHLKFGLTGDDSNRPTDELGYVELRKARSGKKMYARVVDYDYQSYNMDMTLQELNREGRRFQWAIAPILQHAWDWGNLVVNSDALIEHYKNDPEKFPGIVMDEKNEWFSFDPKTITFESANLFLRVISGNLRIW